MADASNSPTASSLQAIISSSSDSLSRLLSGDASKSDISEALEALATLKDDLGRSQIHRSMLLSRIDEHSDALSQVRKRQVQLDNDIIATKMKSGDILSKRDEVARDLHRAEKELQRMEHPVEVNGSMFVKTREGELGIDCAETVVDTSDIHNENDVETVRSTLETELQRLRENEKNLVKVVDDINAIKKKKLEMQDKVKEATDGW